MPKRKKTGQMTMKDVAEAAGVNAKLLAEANEARARAEAAALRDLDR